MPKKTVAKKPAAKKTIAAKPVKVAEPAKPAKPETMTDSLGYFIRVYSSF